MVKSLLIGFIIVAVYQVRLCVERRTGVIPGFNDSAHSLANAVLVPNLVGVEDQHYVVVRVAVLPCLSHPSVSQLATVGPFKLFANDPHQI